MMLFFIIVFVYLIMESLEFLRSKIMHHASISFKEQLNQRVFFNIFQAKLNQNSEGNVQSFSDLKSIEGLIASPTFVALIDVPFSLITLCLVFSLNSRMGWFALFGAIVTVVVSYLNQLRTHPHITEANKSLAQVQNYAAGSIRSAQIIECLGMLPFIHQKWLEKQQKYISLQALASDEAGWGAALSKLFQTMQGSFLLGLGCWLTLSGVMPAGGSMMMIGSILGARVLLPFVKIMTSWRQIVTVQDAVYRLDTFLSAFPERVERMKLPAPSGELSVESAFASAPNSQSYILRNISFKLPAATSLGIIGPSASGKSTLAKLITGVWPASSGKVRLDGADIYLWDKTDLGPYIGYLPQEVDLFDGTIAENIARFGVVDMREVKKAANVVGLADLIESLDQGYNTQVGDEGAFLSGGQRQRLGLARAVYCSPRIIVLDEPNSSLDAAGDLALMNMLKTTQADGATLVVITHKPQILTALDNILVLSDGQVKAYGPTSEILKQVDPKDQNAKNAIGNKV
jgi:ATP-binding cassette subfamily C exporter for protease/lipase